MKKIGISLKEIMTTLEMDKLPKRVSISTMTLTFKCGANINRENVARYIKLNPDKIVSIKHGLGPKTNRSIIKKKKKNNKTSFYNQVTIEIQPTGNNPINTKLFKNESIHMTGVKNMENFNEVVTILYEQLREKKAIFKDGKIIEKPFVDDETKLGIYDLKIRMINSNFKVNFKINRYELYKLLQEDLIECTFEPCSHACVNIKYKHNDKNVVSIFVFESGAIIITGAKTIDQISGAYKFINKKLKHYGIKIILTKIDVLRNVDSLKKYFD